MSRSAKSLLLAEEIDLLVRHFGIQRVRAALAKVMIEGEENTPVAARKNDRRARRPIRVNGANALEAIREIHPEKHRLLNDFLFRLRDRQVLPESQDIRHFAQLIGLKDVSGKSREDLVSKLMRFLIDQPIEKLRIDLTSASDISEHHRQMGFSVLTDKLIGK
jgi:hypothetical protein